ncbi:trypsin-like serine protease [Tuwongella immobilis]|uniref:Peptidase S1 domain-containing protein n=1 Tax=Tuwongella immobilis TaxID=692036 RepID=A0A6C2YU95_9BACT|nr:trypsin-like serine protease [Tuwongella immobilis]VIP04917.1 2-alkenal reductase : Trypsin-like protease OS=bacterium YEK0313 GN=tlp PE=4 SV=1: Trypsin [Tuwongella immobilis]VTS07193.1 2-alkenal reductase : Trypsin-like protease OS=bacterium YEK0313 GN=tlp PE=4 SV=1: Trypsin [Tuwongella immobilis]
MNPTLPFQSPWRLPLHLLRRIASVALMMLGLVGIVAAPTTVSAIDQKMMREAKNRPELVLITATRTRPAPPQTKLASGVLVHPRVVLTAAHVVDGADRWELLFPYATPQSLTRETTQAVQYPGYERGDPDGDLAVLILPQPIDVGGQLPTLHRGPLLRLDQKMILTGRVERGTPSMTKLFSATSEIIPFPGRANLYGGFPRTAQPGDSGGPVTDALNPQTIIGVISGYQPWNRRAVAMDAIMPLGKKSTAWIESQFPESRK